MKEDLLASNLILTANESGSITITIPVPPTREGVNVNYITPAANQPKTYGNHIYVWQTTSNQVPWEKNPDGDTPVNTDSSTSTQPVKFDFEEKGYIVGYAVAPKKQAVCATIFIPANKQGEPKYWEYAKLTMEVVYHGTNLVQVKYVGLPAYQPATNKNWIGIWQGGTVSYSGDPIKKVDITDDDPEGSVTIEGIKLRIGTTYSLGYFMVEPTTGRTSLAATATFTVGASQLTAKQALEG